MGLQALAQTAHQQGHVGTLASPVGVQFVQHQEFQALAMLDHAPVHVLETGQDQLQHHEVGEQDVGRVVGNLLAIGFTFLPGVSGHGKGLLVVWITMQEFVQLFQLAVGQSVHRVDDDGPGALLRVGLLGFEDAVDDGNKKRQRLARARAGGDHVALLLLRLGQCLQLVHVKVQIGRFALGFTRLKDVGATGMKHPLMRQLLDGALPLVIRVDLNQWLGPVAATVVFLLHLGQDVLGGNLGETTRKRAVFVDEPIAEIKDVIHAFSRNGA